MKKPYQPRPAGRHISDPKTGKLTRSGDYTRAAGTLESAKPAPEKQTAAPAAADKKGD